MLLLLLFLVEAAVSLGLAPRALGLLVKVVVVAFVAGLLGFIARGFRMIIGPCPCPGTTEAS